MNEFPDADADADVNKRTLVVRFGVPAGVWVYRIALLTSYIIAVAAIFTNRFMFFAGLFYLLTLPVAVLAIKFTNKKELTTPGRYHANQITVLLHSAGALALTAGFLVV